MSNDILKMENSKHSDQTALLEQSDQDVYRFHRRSCGIIESRNDKVVEDIIRVIYLSKQNVLLPVLYQINSRFNHKPFLNFTFFL